LQVTAVAKPYEGVGNAEPEAHVKIPLVPPTKVAVPSPALNVAQVVHASALIALAATD